MKKFAKMVLIMALAVILGVSTGLLAGCNKKSEKIKIGIGMYQDTGTAVVALKSYLSSIAEDLNAEFQYVTLDFMDETKNKTAAQSLISSGAKGLILTMDSATDAILAEAKKAGVYVAGYLNDYGGSYDTITADGYANKDNFLGTLVDGEVNGSAEGARYADMVIASSYRNIGLVKFPSFAFANQSQMDAAFRAKIAAHNTANPTDIITLQGETTELMFSALESSYFSANPSIDAIVAFCAGAEFVYPTMVSAGKTNLKLFTGGFLSDNDVIGNFGTQGNKCIQRLDFTATETILYPLVMLLNKINGTEFSDKPAKADRVDITKVTIASDADMTAVKTNSLYFTGDVSKALYNSTQVKAFLASEGGSHAKLKEAVQKMGISSIKA